MRYENGPRSGRRFGPIAALPVWNEGVFVARVNEVLKARYSAAASGAGCQSMATWPGSAATRSSQPRIAG